ncbi:MAG: hypothetical protein AAFV53_22550 [Myxococcota bacterium]
MIVALLALSSLPLASAAVPVVFEDDALDGPAAIEQVSKRTGLPADQLTATPIEDLLSTPPRIIGGGVLRYCARDATEMVDIRNEVIRAEAKWREVDPTGAMDHLDLAVSKAGCLTELIEPTVFARMFLLRGSLLAMDGRTEDALAEMRSAIAFQRNLSWDVGFPVEGEPLFEEARAAGTSLAITVEPGPSNAGPWIDGQTITEADAVNGVQVGRGLHLIQTASTSGFRSAWLVAEGDAVLVLPERYRSPVLAAMHSAEKHDAVSALVRAAIEDFQAAYVMGQGGMWLIDNDEITELIPPTPLETAPPAKKRRWWWPFGRR